MLPPIALARVLPSERNRLFSPFAAAISAGGVCALIIDGIAAYPMPVPIPTTVVPTITSKSEPCQTMRRSQPNATTRAPRARVCGAPRSVISRAATGARASIASPLGSIARPPTSRLDPKP